MRSSVPHRSFILQALRSHQDKLTEMGVKSLAVFGSVARDEARQDSDVDILIEFSKPIGLFDFVAVKEYLEELIGRPVDLVTPDAIRPSMKEEILSEAVYA